MIRSVVAHVRGWSFFIKFIAVMTVAFFVTDLFTSKGFPHAFENVLFGATMVAGGEFLAPVVVAALFSALHERTGVEAPCGTPVPPTAHEWHNAVVAVVAVYSFVVVSLTAMSGTLSFLPVLWSAVAFVAPWLGLVLLVALIMEAVHFAGHFRAHRREVFEQEQARDQARKDRENAVTDRTFWEMVRGHKPDPGSVS